MIATVTTITLLLVGNAFAFLVGFYRAGARYHGCAANWWCSLRLQCPDNPVLANAIPAIIDTFEASFAAMNDGPLSPAPRLPDETFTVDVG